MINPDFQKGMSTSIQKALKKIDSQGVEGFFLILKKNKGVRSQHLT